MRSLYVVTHPEASHHLDKRVGGWFDSDLTEAGQSAARAIAQALRTRLPSETVELFSSDLNRARQTAAPIAEAFGTDVTLMPGLREWSFGEAEGQPQAWLDARYVQPPTAGDRMDHWGGVPGYETRRQLGSRVYAALESILDRSCTSQILVTHGGALTFVVACWIKLPLDSAGHVAVRSSSGSITELQEDDYFHNRWIVSLNNMAHLS